LLQFLFCFNFFFASFFIIKIRSRPLNRTFHVIIRGITHFQINLPVMKIISHVSQIFNFINIFHKDIEYFLLMTQNLFLSQIITIVCGSTTLF
jgi:hypothetical protein